MRLCAEEIAGVLVPIRVSSYSWTRPASTLNASADQEAQAEELLSAIATK